MAAAKSGLPCSLNSPPLRRRMEEVFHGSVISTMLGTTWYDCGLQPSAGTKVVVMGKWVTSSFNYYTVTFSRNTATTMMRASNRAR